jgi:hypothetical protein
MMKRQMMQANNPAPSKKSAIPQARAFTAQFPKKHSTPRISFSVLLILFPPSPLLGWRKFFLR